MPDPRRNLLAAMIVAVYAAALPSPCAAGCVALRSELDRVQAEIAQLKHLKAAEIEKHTGTFRSLVAEYLRALSPHVQQGEPFSIMEERSWDERDGPKSAFKRRIEEDMRQWHPVYSLTFVEEILGMPPWGAYVLMLDLPGRTVQDALHRRVEERAARLQEAGYRAAHAHDIADREVLREAVRQWEALSEVIGENAIRILVQALQVDPVSTRLEVVGRIGELLETITAPGGYRELAERVRHGGGSHTLPETIHQTAGNILADQALDTGLKQHRFAQLLHLFVLLQTPESRDHLLLVFGGFDAYDDLLGERAPAFHTTLNGAVVEFILTSLRVDPDGELGLDVVDQLTRWIVTRVALLPDGLRHERILDVLLTLRDHRVTILDDYIRRFYRDFHAFNPAGYETVIFHLVGILVRYAEAGVFTEPDPVGRRGEEPSVLEGEPPPHEKVMVTLRWYNAALSRLAPSLPRIDIDFVDREQRAVLGRIFAYFRDHFDDLRPPHRGLPGRFVETLLQLVKRLALAADPDDIEENVLRPFARARGFDEDPLLFWTRRRVSGTMEVYLVELAVIVASRRSR